MLVVFFSTIFSCLLFDLIKIKSTSKILLNSYKELPGILSSKELSDDEKQKKLILSSKFQMKNLVLLSFKIGFILIPFFSLLLFDLKPSLLMEMEYILVSIFGVIIFILLKMKK